MVNEQIEALRERLNKMIASNSISNDELLRASEELDVLIVKAMKEQRRKRLVLAEEIAG